MLTRLSPTLWGHSSVLKKGGIFVIHDLMSGSRYGDMNKFMEKLKKDGYEDVQLIDTTKGLQMPLFALI